ncbi:MAG TPA: hypothetical protein VKS01_12445 [Bryobacteraceae bacterium]|nr:hypothetical protein [Bryobacteraceae bacterium]
MNPIDESGIFTLLSVQNEAALKAINQPCPPQSEIDRYPPDSAREVKLKPRAPGVPGYPGVPFNPKTPGTPVPGCPGTPGQPGFPGSPSHADIKIYICRQKKCDFVLVHRKLIIDPVQGIDIHWKPCWCKVIVEAQLGVVIVRTTSKTLYLTEKDGEVTVHPLHPPCPPPPAPPKKKK